jgi:hypothetical protein
MQSPICYTRVMMLDANWKLRALSETSLSSWVLSLPEAVSPAT